ncbi:hypothetical protein NH26_23365 [Flammeovirga pacifica]|uniref:CBM6 domain-containing protein n=2 Tax=Flammeovirga pacifica TaxID=915059 RepID=A0A1S1YU11_FLAPC|nr:hypothetical protein NH26_23365 [Flammeovirga pacifica]
MFLCLASWSSMAQSLQHPVIWTTADEKETVLSKIENYEWAGRIIEKAKSSIDIKVNTHIDNPSAILNTIPELAADDNLSESQASANNSKHSKVLNYASYAALVYYTTGEEKYAQFAADILWYYIEEIAQKYPHNTALSGSHFYDPRCGYAQFAIAYDFMVNYLKKDDTKVYQKSSGSKIAFDNVKAQKAVFNIASNALHEHGGADTKYGKEVSNHPILRAPGVLFSILNVEDDEERERMFDVFWNVGTRHQNSFTKSILPMYGNQGVWPEAVSYGFMQNVTLILNLVDRLKPELNVMEDNMHILDGNFLFDNLRMPNRRFVRYGDSHRDIDKTDELYLYTLNLATRRGFDEHIQQAKIALRQIYDANGGYDPSVSISVFDHFSAFEQLFWGIDIPKNIQGEIDFQKPTVIVEHAGVALQRNDAEEQNEDYGLCGIIGGAHYVHSHCTGITMELYGAGYIMAANAGLPKTLAERKIPEHIEYFWRHAGNNTMIVNGTTHGIQQGAWNSDSYLWMNTTVNESAEPRHLEDPIHPHFSFATQYLDDKVNNDEQKRTLSTIRTSESTAYYFDMFRSRSLGDNNFHDYIYHNLGDATQLVDMEGNALSVSATDRYQNDIGDLRKSPGWRFFEDTKATASTTDAVHIRFDLEETNTYMNMFAPGGIAREYTKALGPATREARGGYINKKTQIMAIRQQGEAWDKPYVHIFEPSKSTNSSIKSVDYLYNGEVVVGAKVKTQIGNKIVVDYILCQEDDNSTVTIQDLGIEFDGHFAIVRYEEELENANVTLYIGDGSKLTYGEHSLQADNTNKAQKEIAVKADENRGLGFLNLENNQEFTKGSSIDVEAIVGADYKEVSLFVDDVNVGTLTSAPYKWSSIPQLTDMNNLSYLVRLEAVDNEGVKEERVLTILTPNQWAYTDDNQPHTIPGKIEFEHYDHGGIDIAYWDKINKNSSSFRPDEMVDISSDGSKVRDIKADEWLEFTINVEQSGNYDLEVNHQTRRTPAYQQLSVSLHDEGIQLISNKSLTYTGTSFITEKVGNFYLEKGEHVIRFSTLSYGFDFDYFELSRTSNSYAVTFNDGENTVVKYSKDDGTVDLPSTPIHPAKLFKYWGNSAGEQFDETTIVVENMEVTAVWDIKTFTIDITSEDGEVSISPEQLTYDYEVQVTLTATPKEGFEFVSWTGNVVSTDNPFTVTVDKDLKVTANYKAIVTDISSIEKQETKIYPNPSNGILNIIVPNHETTTFRLYNLNGKVMREGSFKEKITLNGLTNGLYILEIKRQDTLERLKVIIQ